MLKLAVIRVKGPRHAGGGDARAADCDREAPHGSGAGEVNRDVCALGSVAGSRFQNSKRAQGTGAVMRDGGGSDGRGGRRCGAIEP